MTEVTRILAAIEQGDLQGAEQLLPLVYTELRKLAAQKLAQEKPGQTLDATALVHEAYLRLVGDRWRLCEPRVLHGAQAAGDGNAGETDVTEWLVERSLTSRFGSRHASPSP